MEGSKDNPGINYRTLNELFKMKSEMINLTFKITISMLEVYNENIRDLLAGPKDQNKRLEVKQGPSGMFVSDLTETEVTSLDEVLNLFQLGNLQNINNKLNFNKVIPTEVLEEQT